MQKLAVIKMHNQRFAAAGCHPKNQLFDVFLGKLFVLRIYRQARGITLGNKGIEVNKHCRAMIKIVIKKYFCVECGKILKVAQSDRFRTATIHFGKMFTYVIFISHQHVRRYFDPVAMRNQAMINVTAPRCVKSFGCFLHICKQIPIMFKAQQTV
ncbi:MAG: hypothetical protein BWY26_01121 [Elusimicrobia bacterium ADurb.Bin231]|nr:MAG: hypothetical protein BWY26_01121 [Elusimicrobia bacterium ADurb.Bin231]